MRKFTLVALLLCFCITSFSATPNLANYFADKSGCFILFNLNQNQIVTQYNPQRCAERLAADSTFKIALSLMAFDQKLINQKTVFKRNEQNRGVAAWDQDQTPYSWLKNSAVWVSQELTLKLGIAKIKYYLRLFDYGNQDFSGDPGKNNGLTHAWLSSSLKISANEQLTFLKALVMNDLPISQQAMTNTKANMYLETTPDGWKLYGKTGSGFAKHKQGQYLNTHHVHKEGWFVGFIQKDQQTYLFVTNYSDLTPPKTTKPGGIRAKEMTQQILKQLGLY